MSDKALSRLERGRGGPRAVAGRAWARVAGRTHELVVAERQLVAEVKGHAHSSQSLVSPAKTQQITASAPLIPSETEAGE